MTYDQAHKDHTYLWSIGAPEDMTGGYVDQQDLKKLLDSPTKKTAKECLYSQINYWFEFGPDPFELPSGNPDWWIHNDKKVKEIALRHGII